MSFIKWRGQTPLSAFNSLWDGLENPLLNQGLELGTRIPAVNIIEENTKYQFQMAIPGYQKEDFSIYINNGNVLFVSSEQKAEKENIKGKITRREFSYSSFQRSFQLPENVNTDQISAKYEDGILTIDLSKRQTTKVEAKTQIEVM